MHNGNVPVDSQVARLNGLLDKHFETSGPDVYYRREISQPGSGIPFLVLQSSFSKCFQENVDTVLPKDAILDFDTAHALNNLTHSERDTVQGLFKKWYDLGRRHMSEDVGILQQTSHRRILPCADGKETAKRYFTGRNSITAQMPKPTVQVMKDHSFVSVLDCLKDVLARSIPLSFVSLDELFDQWGSKAVIDCLLDSPHSRECMMSSLLKSLGVPYSALEENGIEQTKVHVVELLKKQSVDPDRVRFVGTVLWSDGVDPNCSKTGRSNAWAATVSFVPKQGNWNSRFNTYPLALAREKNKDGEAICHQDCLSVIDSEISQLASQPPFPMFWADEREEMFVKLVQIAHLGDQPERRKVTGLSNGNANYHARFRCSSLHNDQMKVLTPCEKCLKTLRDGKEPQGCPNCCCWDALSKESIVSSKLEVDPPKNYPTRHLESKIGTKYLTESGKITPFQIEYSRLAESAQIAFDNLVAIKWTESVAKAFLQRECFNEKLIDTIFLHAQNAILLKQAKAGDLSDNWVAQAILSEYELEGDQYVMPDLPGTWTSGASLLAFVDCPMHLLFLGIVKKIIQVIKDWLSQQKLFESFKKRAEELNKLLDDLYLEWLNILSFRDGKLGGWVSENYLSFSRLINWFFQHITELIREVEDNTKPPSDIPDGRWYKPHYVRWLTDRGQPAKGSVLALKTLVMKLIEREEGPPPVRSTVAGNVYSTEQVSRVLTSLDQMLKSVMVDEVKPGVTSQIASYWFKLFLTEANLLGQQITTEDKKPLVVSCSNFLTLMNIPSMLENFGPLRLLWEGGVHGEAFVRFIKPYLKFGLRENFATNAMEHCMMDAAFKQCKAAFMNPSSPGDVTRMISTGWEQSLEVNRRSYKTYSTPADVTGILGNRKILSVFVYRCGGQMYIFSVVDNSSLTSPQYHQVIPRSEIPTITKFGYLYCSSYVDSVGLTLEQLGVKFPFNPEDVTWGCLLPLLATGGPCMHTLISKDRWVFA